MIGRGGRPRPRRGGGGGMMVVVVLGMAMAASAWMTFCDAWNSQAAAAAVPAAAKARVTRRLPSLSSFTQYGRPGPIGRCCYHGGAAATAAASPFRPLSRTMDVRLRAVAVPTNANSESKNGGGGTFTTTITTATSTYLATCVPGLAPTLAAELDHLLVGQNDPDITISSPSAVHFVASLEQALHVLVQVRTAHKLLELLCQSDEENSLHDRHDLHAFVTAQVNVRDLLGNGTGGLLTLSCTVKLVGTNLPADLRHSHYNALTIKNALCDAVRALRPDRPNVNVHDADVPLVAMMHGHHDDDNNNNAASISLYRCLHQGSLHQRGYRRGTIHKAALKESVAAGLLYLAGWPDLVHNNATTNSSDPNIQLVDPMAGSGTLVIEAALMAAKIAPYLVRLAADPAHRTPPVTRWKHDVDVHVLWRRTLYQAADRAKRGMATLRTRNITFHANDVHAGAVALLQEAVDTAGLSPLIRVSQQDCASWMLPLSKHQHRLDRLIVTNPPWGVRLNDDHVGHAWQALHNFLRHNERVESSGSPPVTAWILSGAPAATRHLKLRKSRSHHLQVGAQHLRWLQYVLRPPPPPLLSGKVDVDNATMANDAAAEADDHYDDGAIIVRATTSSAAKSTLQIDGMGRRFRRLSQHVTTTPTDNRRRGLGRRNTHAARNEQPWHHYVEQPLSSARPSASRAQERKQIRRQDAIAGTINNEWLC